MAYPKATNKYFAKQTLYNGITYQSKKEAQFAYELDMRVRANDIRSWRRQVKIPLNIYYDRFNRPVLSDTEEIELKKRGKKFLHIANYFIDFVIKHNNGSYEYIEIKGVATGVWKMKWKLTEAILGKRPDIKLTVVY